jgi:hypothetical protein
MLEWITQDDFQEFETRLDPEGVNAPIYPAGISVKTYLIHHACLEGRPKFVELLLERNADPTLLDSAGEPCVFKVLVGRADTEETISILELLFNHDPVLLSFVHAESGENALDYARRLNADERVIKCLVDLGERKMGRTKPTTHGDSQQSHVH